MPHPANADAMKFEHLPCVVLEMPESRSVYIGHPAGVLHPAYRATASRYRLKGWRIAFGFPQWTAADDARLAA